MKKSFFALGICFLFLFGIVLLNSNNEKDVQTPQISAKAMQNEATPKIDPINKTNKVDAIYLNKFNSIKEIKKDADLILIGQVVDQSDFSDLATISTISVIDTIRGKKHDEIKVLQVKNDDVLLNVDSEYILILSKQQDGSADRYYIRGMGYQGAFLNNKGSLENKDDVMSREIESLKQQYHKNAFEALKQFLTEGN